MINYIGDKKSLLMILIQFLLLDVELLEKLEYVDAKELKKLLQLKKYYKIAVSKIEKPMEISKAER